MRIGFISQKCKLCSTDNVVGFNIIPLSDLPKVAAPSLAFIFRILDFRM